MRPTDPAVLKQLIGARGPLVAVLSSGVLVSVLVILQAFALTAVIVAVVRGADLLVPLLALAAVVAARIGGSVVGDVAAGRAAARVGATMRAGIADAVLDGRTGEMTEGAVASLATRGVTAAEPFLTRYVPALVLATVLPLMTVAVVATQDVISALIVLATLPLIPVFGALVGLATRDRAESQWRAMASLSGHFVDVMRGLPTLVAFRRAQAQSGTIRAITNRYRESTLKTLRVAFASSAVLELVATLSVALVAVVVGVRLASGSLDLSTALVVLLLAPEAYWPLRRVGAEFHAAAEGVATFEKMAELGNRAGPPARTGPPDPHRLLIASHATYTYPGRDVAALSDLEVAVPPRAVTAVTGPSGCGKSTLLALLAGLLEPQSGSVHAGGVPTTSVDWQSQVAWLPQRPVFLADTVAANLRLGAPDATRGQLWDALTSVALSERVRQLGGLDALVGEDAHNLSAGERARLALARVVLSARPWVLLDEPTAHLDPITRQVLLDVIVGLADSAGVVVVAHDPAVLDVADRVIALPGRTSVPDEGRPHPLDDTEPTRTDVVQVVDAPGPGAPARFVLSTFLGVLASFSGVALTATAGWLIVKASEHPATLTLLVAIVGVRAFGLGRPVFRYAERLRSHDAALKTLAERRVQVYEAVVPLTPGRLGKRRGDVLTSIVDDVDAVLDDELRVKLPLRTYAAVLVAVAAVCALILPVAAAAVAATSVAGAAVAYLVARSCTGRPEAASVQARADLSTTMVEAAHLAPELRMWQAASVVETRVATASTSLGRATCRVADALALARGAIHASSLLGVAAVAILSADALAAGTVSAPAAALLLLVPVALADVALPVVEAAGLHGRIAAAQARLGGYALMTPAVTEATPAADAGPDATVAVVHAALGWADQPVLRSVSLHLDEGTKLAVVGPSGSGKSTLAAALVRFIDPLSGAITLGGRSLADLRVDDVRGAVGYVDDDPHVFATTLAENVRLARPGATDADVRRALRQARLGPWVGTLPDGLDTWLGDGHAQVSGGERARLGLARSLLLDQRVLVLDEPVAHLDAATARALAEDLLDATDGRTVVWITHNQVGLEGMDEVLDLGGCDGAGDLSELNHA